MSRIERKYCSISTSYLAGLFDIISVGSSSRRGYWLLFNVILPLVCTFHIHLHRPTFPNFCTDLFCPYFIE